MMSFTRRILYWVAVPMLLSGCTAAEWNSFMYGTNTQTAYDSGQIVTAGFKCPYCGRSFTADVNKNTIPTTHPCPFCGTTLNLQQANNIYLYDQQQQSAINTQQALNNIAQIQAEHGRRRQELYSDYIKSRSQRGNSPFRPIYTKPGY